MQKTKNDLEMDFIILDKWFHENHMVLNLGKCQYIVIDDDGSSHQIISINNKIASSNEYNFLGILLDNKLNLILIFIYLSLYKKAGQKLSALVNLVNLVNLDFYFSIFKQCIQQDSQKGLMFDLQ